LKRCCCRGHQTLRPAVNRVLIDGTFQLRSLRVVTQSAHSNILLLYLPLSGAACTV
jgi:hypothetical protein